MRLFEFDQIDRTAFKTRFGITIEESLIQIIEKCNDIKRDYKILSRTAKGKSALESTIGSTMDDVKILFNFYNKCNVDNETKEYLDKLIELNNELVSMLDSIQ